MEITRDELHGLYVEQRLSTREIAEMYGVNQTTVVRWLAKQGIEGRAKSENKMPTPKGGHHSWGRAISGANTGNPKVGKRNLGKRGPDAPNWKGGQQVDADGRVSVWVPEAKAYVKRAHLVWLAEHPGEVIGRGYVIHHDDRNPANDSPENLQRLSVVDHVRLHGKMHRVKVAVQPKSTGYDRGKKPDETMLADLYRECGVNATARYFGVSRQTVYNWLDGYGIPRTGRTEGSERRRLVAVASTWREA
jgi:transposase